MTESAEKANIAAPNVNTNLWQLAVICVLGWIVPGFGHILLKKFKRGAAFSICIILLFFAGLGLGAKIWRYETHQPLTFFAMVSQAGVGVPYFVARAIASYQEKHPSTSAFHKFAETFGYGDGKISNITFEYGNTFTWVAGLLNFLVILDAYDIAVGRKK